jgi:hypothetical protein
MYTGVNHFRDYTLRQAFAMASTEEEPYKDLPPNILQELIKHSHDEDLTAKEAQ